MSILAPVSTRSGADTVVQIDNLSLRVAGRTILHDIRFECRAGSVVGVVGPSGSGKTSLLRCLNRLTDLVPDSRVEGQVFLDGVDIHGRDVSVPALRQTVGMVFQKPVVFPQSIYDNVLFGIRALRLRPASQWGAVASRVLERVTLWNEVRGRLQQPAATLSLGQQQRLCLARSLAVEPRLILMDEPTSSLDPRSAAAIEALVRDLRQDHAILLVSHDLDQVRRVADEVVFMCEGAIVERGPTEEFFDRPREPETREYLRWHTCTICHHRPRAEAWADGAQTVEERSVA